MSAMLQSERTVATTLPLPLPPLPVLDRIRPPPRRDGPVLLSKRSGTLYLPTAAVGRTAKANDNSASSADAIADTAVVDSFSSLAATAKSSELSAPTTAATAIEMTAINAYSDNKEEAVILRSNFVNAGGVGFWGSRL